MAAGGSYTDDIIGALDGDELNGLLAELTRDQSELFGGRDFISVLRGVLSGEIGLNFSNVTEFIFSVIGSSLSALAVLLATVVGVSVIYSVVGALKGGRHTESVSKAAHVAATACIVITVGVSVTAMFTMCAKTLSSMATQINVLVPVILTLIAGVGGGTTAAVFSPAVAVITSGMFNLISSVLMPMLAAAFVFGVVGSISGEGGPNKMSSFLRSAVKWLFGTGFFVLTAVMSIQGVTANVMDNLGVRGAKFAIGKYVPVIGGYMSEGFNLVVSGGIAIKNALGYTALVLLLLTILPAVMQIAVLSLCLKLSAAIAEPFGDKQMGDMLQGISKTVSLAGGMMFGAGFLYFVFMLILMAAGNIFL